MTGKDGQPKGAASVPEPRQRRRTSLGYIVFSLLVTMLGIAVLAGLALFYGSRQLAEKGPLTEARTVVIDRGLSSSGIAKRLFKSGVISNERVFFVASVMRGRMGDTLKAGEYQFSPGDSMGQVLEKITTGKALVYKVTIPEGMTSQQVLQRLSDIETLKGELPASVPEGALLPDTYVFNRGMTRAAVLKQMRDAQLKLVDELWEKRVPGLPVKTKEQVLILASIVEKETGVAAERARVAAVFHNRLLRGMRLQSDPTIIYGIVGGKGKLDRAILRSDIEKKTAYNTYQIDGLPPTPIANPGREAILAVLQPEATDELYFVADGSGGHVFAKTLEEHNANVRNWRKIEQEKRLAAANPAASEEAEEQAAPAEASAEKMEAPAAPKPAVTAEPAQTAPKPEAQAEQATETTAGELPPVAPGDELPVEGAEQAETTTTAAATERGKVPLPRRKPAIQ